MNNKPFHFTIASTPKFGPDDNFTLDEELVLVKTAILYGDQGRLCSPGTSMVMQLQDGVRVATDTVGEFVCGVAHWRKESKLNSLPAGGDHVAASRAYPPCS